MELLMAGCASSPPEAKLRDEIFTQRRFHRMPPLALT